MDEEKDTSVRITPSTQDDDAPTRHIPAMKGAVLAAAESAAASQQPGSKKDTSRKGGQRKPESGDSPTQVSGLVMVSVPPKKGAVAPKPAGPARTETPKTSTSRTPPVPASSRAAELAKAIVSAGKPMVPVPTSVPARPKPSVPTPISSTIKASAETPAPVEPPATETVDIIEAPEPKPATEAPVVEKPEPEPAAEALVVEKPEPEPAAEALVIEKPEPEPAAEAAVIETPEPVWVQEVPVTSAAPAEATTEEVAQPEPETPQPEPEPEAPEQEAPQPEPEPVSEPEPEPAPEPEIPTPAAPTKVFKDWVKPDGAQSAPTDVIRPHVKPVEAPAEVFRPDAKAAKPTPATPKPEARPKEPPKTVPAAQPKAAAKTKPKTHNPWRWLLVVLLVLVLAGVGTLLTATKYFSGKAKIGTELAGMSVGGQTPDELRATAQQLGGNLSIITVLNGKQMMFNLGALGITVNQQATADQVLAAASGTFGWFPINKAQVPLVFDYSTDKIRKTLSSAYGIGPETPEDATVALDETTGQFKAADAVPSQIVNSKAVEDAIATLAQGQQVGLVSLTIDSTPAPISTEAASKAAATANSMTAQTYTFSTGNKTYTLKPDEIAGWVTLTPDDSTGVVAVGVDSDVVKAQLPGILNYHLATPPINQRVLYSPEGEKITTAVWGQNGTVVADTDTVAEALIQALSNDQPLDYGVQTRPEPYQIDKVTVGGAYDQPHGSKWVDVNQTTFVVSMYEGTTLIYQMPCVTGSPYPATATTNGTFYVYYMLPIQTMKGTNPNGTPYTQPNVPWVMYFNGSQALHGAYWRSTFGYKASHGCVNLPVPDAKIMYDWMELGTRVVVHG